MGDGDRPSLDGPMESPGQVGVTVSFDRQGVRAVTGHADPLGETTLYQRPDPRHPQMSDRMRAAEAQLNTAVDHLRSVTELDAIADAIGSVVLFLHDLVLHDEWNSEGDSREVYGTWAATLPIDGTAEEFHAARDDVVSVVHATIERVHQWATEHRQSPVLPDARNWEDQHLGHQPPTHGDDIAYDTYAVLLMEHAAQTIGHAHQRLRPVVGDALAHLQQVITELHGATDPTAIRDRVADVLLAANHVFYTNVWHPGLDDEHSAWEALDPHVVQLSHAPGAVAEAAQQVHDMVYNWVSTRSMAQDWTVSRDMALGHLIRVAAEARTSHSGH